MRWRWPMLSALAGVVLVGAGLIVFAEWPQRCVLFEDPPTGHGSVCSSTTAATNTAAVVTGLGLFALLLAVILGLVALVTTLSSGRRRRQAADASKGP